ncbi:MAG: acyltransferase domain-containing protein, partial [Anaerolineaceae bacterium]|nr:acyltransferase domain-containing protein [Anaerolineaceae bacterium]
MASHRKETTQAPFASLSDHPVAIIGLGSIFPQAENISTYWDNIFNEVDCVTDIPASRWAVDDYYDPNPAAPDKTYSKRGAFIPDIDFNPMEFGLPPNILEVTDVSQLLSLVVAKQALSDAGYLEGPDGLLDRTGVILGMVGIASKVAVSLSARLQFPIWQRALDNVGIQSKEADRVIEKIKAAYIDWNENAFPGALGNIVAGRITNRFNLGGTNCTIDAACGSSLAAFTMAVSELVEGRADMMITGGVDIDNSALTYLCFSKTPALSKNEKVRTFDEKTDGMLPGEGIGMVVLKRLADAKRDGDQIYALIRGIGTSSDGRFKSIYAPRPEGQAKALRRAYEQAGFAPQTVGLIEAHGTGTPAGDPAEFAGLRLVFTNEDQSPPQIALGSVKSQIGHTKAAAGTAGMIKAALALHHKILPATINVDQPNAKFDLDGSLFYINNQTRPWILRDTDDVRRAGVSAFGFGGTNFHIVLEEYAPEHTTAYRMRQGAGMLLLHHPTHAGLIGAAEQMLSTFRAENGDEEFAQQTQTAQNAVVPAADARLAFAAVSPDEAIDFLEISLQFLRGNPDAEQWEHPKGIYFRANALETKGHVVVLFPGQGAQYVNMGKELALQYPAVRQTFAEANHLRAQRGLEPISSSVFPVPVFTQDAQAHQKEDLTRTENAQPAIGTLSVAMYKLLRDAGLKADFFAGHSFGELTALWGAGVYDETAYLSLAIARGQAMGAPADVDADPGTMLAVKGDADAILKAAQSLEDVMVANINSHAQVVLAGSKPAIARAQSALAELGFATVPLSVSAAFHTPLVAHAQKPFATAIRQAKFSTPSVPVFSNNTAQPHAADPTEIQQRLENHILGTVNFREEIRNIHAAGGTIFIEVGPRNILTNLVKNILANETISAVALNPNHRLDSDLQLRQAYLQLKVLGLPLGVLDPFFRAPAPAERPANSKLNVKLNGGVYLSDATKA